MGCSTPSSSVLHCLPKFAQIHLLWVGDELSDHLILCRPPSPFAVNLSQHQGRFQWAGFSFVYKMLKSNLNDQLLLLLSIFSCVRLCGTPMDCSSPGSSVYGASPGKNTRVGCYAFPQGIFPTQGSNPDLPHCRWILYQLCTWSAYHSKNMQHQSILYSPFKIDRWRNSTRKSLELNKKIW